MDWVGHIMCRTDNRWAQRVSGWIPINCRIEADLSESGGWRNYEPLPEYDTSDREVEKPRKSF